MQHKTATIGDVANSTDVPQCLSSARTIVCDGPLTCRFVAWECRFSRLTNAAGPDTKPRRRPEDRIWSRPVPWSHNSIVSSE